MEDKLYTVTVYSENQVGLLSAISSIFTRRSINIWSLSVSASSIPGVHKFTIATRTFLPKIQAVVKQIEKRIDVIKAFYYTNEDIVYRELALYKVNTEKLLENSRVEEIISRYNAMIVEMNTHFTVLQMTGHCDETMELCDALRSVTDVYQFVRSGRVAVTRADREYVDEFLEERELVRRSIENSNNI
ncbi:MAG: acetolactate synthase small subunit [Bacteroidales bacterium]|nr:acetolactate synthase small subunit [Bacteroidales bacterium]